MALLRIRALNEPNRPDGLAVAAELRPAIHHLGLHHARGCLLPHAGLLCRGYF